MPFGDFQQLPCGSGRFAATLFPSLQGALRYAQRRGKLTFRELALEPHARVLASIRVWPPRS